MPWRLCRNLLVWGCKQVLDFKIKKVVRLPSALTAQHCRWWTSCFIGTVAPVARISWPQQWYAPMTGHDLSICSAIGCWNSICAKCLSVSSGGFVVHKTEVHAAEQRIAATKTYFCAVIFAQRPEQAKEKAYCWHVTMRNHCSRCWLRQSVSTFFRALHHLLFFITAPRIKKNDPNRSYISVFHDIVACKKVPRLKTSGYFSWTIPFSF